MNKPTCDACGSSNTQIVTSEETRQLTLGEEFSFSVPSYKCLDCEEEGYLGQETEQIRSCEMDKARAKLAVNLIDQISDSGIKLAYIERAFELPQRTISSKWRSGRISASGLALLRIVKMMPWTVEIADNKFSRVTIFHSLVNAVAGLVKNDGGHFTGAIEPGLINSVHMSVKIYNGTDAKISEGLPCIATVGT